TVIARASELFIPTLRDDPADAEAVSHKLLVRGGFIRQVAGGLWTFLPLGWRVHRKIERIIREELDAFGAQEINMPVLTPAELWETTGRIAIPELFRLKDRAGRDYVLPLTHEETVAFHAREIQSYKELPQLWYHFQTKDRDEPRPRGGLLRVREFVMKDGYSFDRDDEGVLRSFESNRTAYHRIFERCGIETFDVQAESGIMGPKLFDALAGAWRPANDEEIRAGFGAGGGSLGPVGFEGEIVADETLREGQFVAGANRDGWHLKGVEAGRDYQPRFADLREPREGDRCPDCGGALRFRTAIEVGHIFNFGSFYSAPLEATFLDKDGQEKPLL